MSDDDGFKLSRRKALAGIGGIGVASAGAGLGTSAYFSDAASFEGNSLTAGQLDLRIDWQQLYYGPEENTDNYAPYGAAGRPFVNAHPDAGGENDPDGEQSLEWDDELYTYSDNDANIQEALNCESLENFEVPEDFDNGVRGQDSLIELEDVKPGDCGEVTFSLHLCDNPGYIWWIGQVGQFDEELAKAIQVKAWYDIECTNRVNEEDGDQILVETTDLHTFLEDRLTPDGRMLNPEVYGAGTGVGGSGGDGTEDVACEPLGKIEFAEDGAMPENPIGSEETTEGEILEVREDPLEYVFRFVNTNTGVEVLIELRDMLVKENGGEVTPQNETHYDIGEVVEWDWSILYNYTDQSGDQYTSDDVGMCQQALKAGSKDPKLEDLVDSQGCSTGKTNQRTPHTGPNNQPLGMSHIEFWYCPDGDDPGRCFPENETFCVAFEWCFPTTAPEGVADINDLQGQSVAFDLGFYTEQCRHNDNPDGPSGFS